MTRVAAVPVHVAGGARQRGHVCGGSAALNLSPLAALHVTTRRRSATCWRANRAPASCSRRVSASVPSHHVTKGWSLMFATDDVVANVFRCLQSSSWPSLAVESALPPGTAPCFYNDGDVHAPPLPSSVSSSSSVYVHCNLWAHSRSEFITCDRLCPLIFILLASSSSLTSLGSASCCGRCLYRAASPSLPLPPALTLASKEKVSFS
jgi:hypothetical protein